MWPFKAKTPNTITTPDTLEDVLDKIERKKNEMSSEMESWRSVGQTFTYLGREFSVTGYFEMVQCGMWFSYTPLLKARYFDRIGVMHDVSFTYAEFLSIKSQNEPSGETSNDE